MRKPNEEDSTAFRDAVGEVRPLAAPAKVVQRRKPAPRASFRRREEAAILIESITLSPTELEVESGEELSFRRSGIQDSVMRKLRRGQYRVESEIDLHGLTVIEAKEALRGFISRAIFSRQRCVRIVHGKGLRSGHRGPVIKNAVNVILRHTGPVVAFCSARQVDGGPGAVYALLSD